MKLYVIGLGPGEQTQMTPKAMAAIADSDVIAGYTVYIDLIKHLTQEKEILTTPTLSKTITPSNNFPTFSCC